MKKCQCFYCSTKRTCCLCLCNRNIEYIRNCNHTFLSLRHESGRAFEVSQEIQFLQLAHKSDTRDEQYVIRMSIMLLSLCASNRASASRRPPLVSVSPSAVSVSLLCRFVPAPIDTCIDLCSSSS